MKQVDASHYEFSRYVGLSRFASYWRQVSQLQALAPRNVLEIGPGPGVVTAILRQSGFDVTTVDHASDVGVDVVASVLHLPFKDAQFDAVLCCQVLEHLEYRHFATALQEVHRVARKGAVLSLPHAGRYFRCFLDVPLIGSVRIGFGMQPFPEPHVFDGQHHWEIGKRGYPLAAVRRAIARVFKSTSDERLWHNPYHHFFSCRK